VTELELVLQTPAHFKALGHPVRHRIVNVLRQRPATLGQLGAALGLAKGTISFHVRVLRAAGLVELAGTRHVRGGTEQYFALVSGGFRVPGAAGAQFLVQAALEEMRPAGGDEPGHTVLRHLWLSQQQARALAARLEEFAVSQDSDDANADHANADHANADDGIESSAAYGLLLSLYPTDIPRLPHAD
jgi:DNA-binding transcriptional ArsR family regulator